MSFLLFSCGSSEPFHNIVFADGSDSFNRIIDLRRSAATDKIYGGGYYVTFDDEHRTAQLTISNLKIADDIEGVTLTFDNVPWNYSSSNHQKQRVISIDELISEDAQYGTIRLTDVVIVYSESNDMDQFASHGLYATYVVNSRFRVVAYPYHVFAEGTTRFVDLSGSDWYDYTPIYIIDLNPETESAAMKIYDIMGGNITIDDLSMEFTDDGYRLIPFSHTKTESALGEITNIEIQSHLHDRLDVKFTLSRHEGPISVEAFLSPNLSGAN